MRYLLLTYYTKPDGRIDEAMTVSTKLRTRDWQTANVIMDFAEQQVLKCRVGTADAVTDWDRVVSTYYPHYTSIIERLFEENGHAIDVTAAPQVSSN